ncbi:hypothetical protein PHLCEN_2v6375 [Hermanssonia centrifuga]|uniref:Reverse transcriptase domain-containing protein n=1 Tax=Hermanssonia centrifuga TaxID=98765 RepID=A0A2R6NZL3_9APHY|nr:hypothetical protein PHLCEN_2v6375 [Hermanssonia centrifuga]
MKGLHGRPRLSKSNNKKSKALHKTFFPPPGKLPPEQEVEEIPKTSFEFKGITRELIQEVIKKLKRYKAPGIDDFPNEAFKWCKDILVPILYYLFQATYKLGFYPDLWKISQTLVLQKPQRKDYTLPNVFWPIALLNTWRTQKVASILFLDVKAVFPSVNPERLFHILQKKEIPKCMVDRLKLKMRDRCTVLCFDDFQSKQLSIESGLEQGYPLSVILYQFYNSDLLDSAKKQNGETATGNIDDVAIVAVAETFERMHKILKSFMTRLEGAF